mgnify:CR=1 FL=1
MHGAKKNNRLTIRAPEAPLSAPRDIFDDCGLRAKSIGGARVSDKHCGFIINYDNASFDDVISLINYVKKTVYEKTGIMLCEEVKILKNKD